MGLVAELLVLHLIGRDWPHSKEKKARGLEDDGTGNNHHPPVPPPAQDEDSAANAEAQGEPTFPTNPLFCSSMFPERGTSRGSKRLTTTSSTVGAKC